MLTNSKVLANIPSTDLKRTRDFYEGKLGLKVVEEQEGMLVLEAGEKTYLFSYQRGPSKAAHTLATFMVDDIEKEIDELTQKGVVFEQYDLPGIKTNEKGIADAGGQKAAWFKDPDENILGLAQK